MTADVLILYDPEELYVGTIREHLSAFSKFSRNRIFYAVGPRNATAPDLAAFDAVVIHYSVRVCIENRLSPAIAKSLTRYSGAKVLFIQDEYDTTETARRAIETLGISLVFTCVPSQYVEHVYPQSRFPNVEFVQNLTGYVPAKLEGMRPAAGSRRWLIGYRGRNLPYWYGDLGQEKVEIGRRMKAICKERGLPVNIEWADEHRIYGDGWYDFLRNCKATLGSESGSNVFDEYGCIRHAVEAELKRDPAVTYEALRTRLIAPHEGRIRMNQASPRLFEAVACGSALVLFEGGYSGVVLPDEHFIPLRKDFSNVDDVLAKLQDDGYVRTLTHRAYSDVIESQRHSYRTFVGMFDDALSRHLATGPRAAAITTALIAEAPLAKQEWPAHRRLHQGWMANLIEDAVTLLKPVWRLLPLGLRTKIRRHAF